MMIPTRWGDTARLPRPRLRARLGGGRGPRPRPAHVHSGAGPDGLRARPGHRRRSTPPRRGGGRPGRSGSCSGRGVFERHPGLRYVDHRERGLVAARHRRAMDEKWVGGHNTRKFGDLFRERSSGSRASTSARNCFLGASTPGVARDRRPRRGSASATCCGATTSRTPRAPCPTPGSRSTTCSTTCPDDEAAPDPRPQRRRGLPASTSTALAPSVERIGPTHRRGPRMTGPDVDRGRDCASAPWLPDRIDTGDRRRPCVGLADAPQPGAARRRTPAGPGPHGHATASRSRSPTAGSSSPRPTSSLPARSGRSTTSAGTSSLYRTESGEPRTRRRPLPPPRRPPRGRRQGRGRVHRAARSTAGPSTATPASASTSPTAASERIPAKARVRSYPTVERNGLIWAWHHRRGGRPFYERPGGARARRPRVDRRRCCASSASPRRARRWPRTTTTSPTSSSSTAPTPSPRATSTSRAPTSDVTSAGLERETFGLGLGVAARPGRSDLRLLGHADRRGQRPRPLGLHRARGHRCAEPLEQFAEQFTSRRHPGHPDLGEQDLPAPPGAHEERGRASSPTATGPGSSTAIPSSC